MVKMSKIKKRVYKFLEKNSEGNFKEFLGHYPETPPSTFYSLRTRWLNEQETEVIEPKLKKSKSIKINVGKDVADEILFLQWRVHGLEQGYFDRKF